MDEHEQHERALRRKAMRLWQQGLKPREILKRIARSRPWLWKWRKRFEQHGPTGLRSQARRPQSTPHRYPASVRRLVIRLRHQLEKRQEGWIGAGAIRREIETQRLLPQRPIPTLATINRWLLEAGCFPKPGQSPTRYFPQPTGTARYRLHLMDWTARYLPGGTKVFAFHTLDLHTQAVKQTICGDKRTATACQHVLDAWQDLGLPDGLQIDNDAAFNGGNRVPRVIGQFVRLCLYVGIEIIFIPEQEAERNGAIEGVNSRWGRAWWRRRHFHSLAEVRRTTPRFETWHAQHYGPSPEAEHWPTPRHLRATQVQRLPTALPITAGRIHFIRLVKPDGTIRLLNESWHIHKRLAGCYVWATISTHEQQLSIYYRPAATQPVRLVKRFAYPFPEPVAPLRSEFRRPYRRRKMSTML